MHMNSYLGKRLQREMIPGYLRNVDSAIKGVLEEFWTRISQWLFISVNIAHIQKSGYNVLKHIFM